MIHLYTKDVFVSYTTIICCCRTFVRVNFSYILFLRDVSYVVQSKFVINRFDLNYSLYFISMLNYIMYLKKPQVLGNHRFTFSITYSLSSERFEI
jgi:hypothetical protein